MITLRDEPALFITLFCNVYLPYLLLALCLLILICLTLLAYLGRRPTLPDHWRVREPRRTTERCQLSPSHHASHVGPTCLDTSLDTEGVIPPFCPGCLAYLARLSAESSCIPPHRW